jgi:diguanylate cyclase (GGDEF)-like protein
VNTSGTPTVVARRSRAIARGCVAVASAIGATTLIGWALDVSLLKSVLPGLVAMNPLTAVCFLLAAASLAPRADGSRGWASIAQGTAAALVAVAGLFCLAGYLSGHPSDLDQILFANKLAGGGGLPNRMAPNTAFDFVALGAAVLLLRGASKGTAIAGQGLAMFVGFNAFIALLGYAYSVTSFSQVASFIPMALHTAFTFGLLATSALLRTPEKGLIARATSLAPGGRLIRQLAPAFLVFPPLVGWLRLQGELHGLYSTTFGTALMAGALVVIGIGLTWSNAVSLDHADEVRRQVELATQQLAYYDALTGLPNRALFTDRLTLAIARAHRYGGLVAVMFLDLDGFKSVNDTLGHAGGDALLKSVGHRLLHCVRPSDTAARLAGDEFTLVLTDVRDVAAAEAVAARCLSSLAAPHDVLTQQRVISATIGIAIVPNDGTDVATLVRKADLAMYRAKRSGKNRAFVYRDE